jgi:hypothetical protein
LSIQRWGRIPRVLLAGRNSRPKGRIPCAPWLWSNFVTHRHKITDCKEYQIGQRMSTLNLISLCRLGLLDHSFFLIYTSETFYTPHKSNSSFL